MGQARKDDKGRALRKGEIQRKSDNRYAYTFVDPLGRTKRVYAKTLQELREKEDQLTKLMLDGIDVYIAGEATLNYLFERYISTKTELREHTKQNYIYMYNRFVRDTFGKKKIIDIRYSEVYHFYVYLLNEKKLSIGTVESIHCVLHPTFDMAVRDEIIRINPSDGVLKELKHKQIGRQAAIRHALTPEQQKAFMDYVREHSQFLRWAPLFTVMLGTGLRVGEVIGLTWDDLDMEKRLISVNHTLTYYEANINGQMRHVKSISLPKTEAGIRFVPMMDSVYEAFQEEEKYHEILKTWSVEEIDGFSGFVFTSFRGMTLQDRVINDVIKRVVDEYNCTEMLQCRRQKRDPIILPRFSCHTLRHTFCSRLCENETNVKIIQTIMGHKDIQTTMDIYAEINDDRKTEAMLELAQKVDAFKTDS